MLCIRILYTIASERKDISNKPKILLNTTITIVKYLKTTSVSFSTGVSLGLKIKVHSIPTKTSVKLGKKTLQIFYTHSFSNILILL